MSDSDAMMQMYAGLTKAYNWTPAQIDDQEIEVIFGYIAAMSEEEEQGQYIDEVWN